MTRRTPALPGFDADLPYDGTIDTCFTARIAKERAPATPAAKPEPVTPPDDPIPEVVRGPPGGDKAKAKDILAAIKTLKRVESEQRLATEAEREVMKRFCGFGPVALGIFPDPVTGKYKDHAWQVLGEELKSLLTDDEYASAKRTTFCAFYTAPVVMDAMHDALKRLGVPEGATVLEPGCGVGNFVRPGYRFIGVELDSTSGRLAKAIHPEADIRIEDFQRTKLPQLDAVIGNVPFADIKLTHNGQKFSLHDYFFAKSVDALAPGGVLALVTSHFTMDKANASIREYLGDRADFLGAIRLPSDAFKKEGTAVVTDIVFMRKRALDEPPSHADPDWLKTEPTDIDERTLQINTYFKHHPEMVLGTYSGKDTLYGEGYSVVSNGNFTWQLKEAVERLPAMAPRMGGNPAQSQDAPAPKFVPPPPEQHISEGSFFVASGKILQVIDGQSVPVVYGGTELSLYKGIVGKRMGALIKLRDLARQVLKSQNDDWPEKEREVARRDLNRAYDAFRSAYGPINKTTVSETKDGGQIRRMPNVVKFREDPDAMLVMALEEYDEETDTAAKAPIMLRDVVGKTPPITHVESAEQGLLVSLDRKGRVDLDFIAELYGKDVPAVIEELGELIFHDPKTDEFVTADEYLSGNVRQKLKEAKEADLPEYVKALEAVQPEDVLPGDIDANLGCPWVPVEDVRQFATELFKVEPNSIKIEHLPKDAVWSVEGDWHAERAVPVTTDYGTPRASGLWLFELAMNLKTPTIYDPAPGDPDKRVVNQEATLAAKEKQKLIKERFKDWVFSDPERTERLVRLYNDAFNNLRPRHFDGSHLDFPGISNAAPPLRQHQRDAVWRIMSGGNTLLAHVVGAGKAQPLDAKVLTPTGWARMGDILVGDKVIAGDGSITTVTGVFPQGKKEVFKLTFKDGGSTRACGDHLWMTQTANERQLWRSARDNGHVTVKGQPKVRTTDELRRTLDRRHCVPLNGPVQFPKRDLPLDPYTLGVLLGNACFTQCSVQLAVPELAQLDLITLPPGVAPKYWSAPGKCPIVYLVAGYVKPNPLNHILRELGLWGHRSRDKFVPPEYLTADVDSRLALLQGLMDTDGGMSGRQARFTSYSSQLANDLVFLVRSLGGVAYLHVRPGAREGSLRYNVGVMMPEGICPFRLPRKLAAWHRPAVKKKWIVKRPLISIEAEGFELCQCISVAHSSRLYVTDDFVVTHNTGVMAAGAMKLRQAGIVKKPMVVCANHLLEQFSREFQQWYPNAKLLVATKDDLSKDRRKLLTAKIASGDWDAIIVTHSSFERIGMSRDYQERFLREQIAEYEALLCDNAGSNNSKAKRNLLKQIEKQKAAREEKLKELLAEDKKDGGLVFDELGVDHIFIDESQYGKNLSVATKLDRVAGIQTGGSERAFDLFMKCRYLHQKHPGHGVTFASGTPISNSMVEMYTQQRYLDPDGLKDRGIEHFDAWAASFGEVVEAMEISPDGKSLRPRSRFAKFVNLPELQQMFRAFSDVQTAEMLNLPRPALKGGKPETVACPMSDEQKEIQDRLVERYERIRNGGVDPRDDNALAITTDGRKLALDARMVSAEAHDFPGSKINALVENIVAIHRLHLPTKGTQMVFCDMGIHPTPWGFSAYDEIIRKLVDRGIPREQIAAIGEADSDTKKAALFEKVRNGSVRVLIGSTAKLGTGTNVQKRLVALHHLDAPWKPAEVEQREGRILRQGNENAEVMIYRYVTEQSFDAYMWQALETKARFINQVMTGQSGVRRAEDVGGQELSYAEVKAIASGNPAVLTLAEADAELQRLAVLRRNHADTQFLARRNLRELPGAIERTEKRLAGLTADLETLKSHDDLLIGGKPAAEATLARALNAVPEQSDRPRDYTVGKYRGLTFGIELFAGGADLFLEGQTRRTTPLNSRGTRAVMNALTRISDCYGEKIEEVKKDLELSKSQLADFQARLDKPFLHAAYLEELAQLRDKLKLALADKQPQQEGEEEGPSAAEVAEQIKKLMSSHKVESAPRVRAEKVEPLRRRVEKPVQREEPEKEKAPEPVKVPEPVEEPEEAPIVFRHRVVSKSGQMSLF